MVFRSCRQVSHSVFEGSIYRSGILSISACVFACVLCRFTAAIRFARTPCNNLGSFVVKVFAVPCRVSVVVSLSDQWWPNFLVPGRFEGILFLKLLRISTQLISVGTDPGWQPFPQRFTLGPNVLPEFTTWASGYANLHHKLWQPWHESPTMNQQ